MAQLKNVTDGIDVMNSETKKKEYNDRIARKTGYYQQKFGFETNPRQGHEYWNVEADAFKHAFMSADLYFKYGNLGSLCAGIYHEKQTPNNPQGEWNMDSWNNHQGREIAKEIQKEYGKNFYKLPKQKQDDIIAVKIMMKMRNGELITHPDDKRKYNGWIEKVFNEHQKKSEGQVTGKAAPIEERPHIFSAEEIGKMTQEEFSRNEAAIMEQMKNGQIIEERKQKNYGDLVSPDSNVVLYTREDISNMSTDEYAKHEKAIMSQMKKMGIPSKRELPSNAKTYSTDPKNGKWVTINGNHIFIDK